MIIWKNVVVLMVNGVVIVDRTVRSVVAKIRDINKEKKNNTKQIATHTHGCARTNKPISYSKLHSTAHDRLHSNQLCKLLIL